MLLVKNIAELHALRVTDINKIINKHINDFVIDEEAMGDLAQNFVEATPTPVPEESEHSEPEFEEPEMLEEDLFPEDL